MNEEEILEYNYKEVTQRTKRIVEQLEFIDGSLHK